MFLAARAAPLPPPTEIDRRAAADTMTSAHSSSQDEIDQQKYTAFDDERVNTTEVNLWARVKKVEPKT